jgi:hypothetical protein
MDKADCDFDIIVVWIWLVSFKLMLGLSPQYNLIRSLRGINVFCRSSHFCKTGFISKWNSNSLTFSCLLSQSCIPLLCFLPWGVDQKLNRCQYHTLNSRTVSWISFFSLQINDSLTICYKNYRNRKWAKAHKFTWEVADILLWFEYGLRVPLHMLKLVSIVRF